MGFFENLGRKAEEFKQTARETAAEGTTHVCRSCGEQFYEDHDTCLSCGDEAVVERKADGPDGANETGGPDGANEAGGPDGANEADGPDGANEADGPDGANEAGGPTS